MVLVVVFVVITVNPLQDRQFIFPGVLTALSYTSDIPYWPLHELNDITHLWTLAIEEQFYIVWPGLLLTCAARGWLRQLTWGAFIASCAALLGTVAYGHDTGLTLSLYTWLTPWIISLVLGCSLAIGTVRVQVSTLTAVVVLVALLGLTMLPEAKSHAWGYLLLIPVAGVLSVGLISNAASARPAGLLTNTALRYLGMISYAAYLWDYPLAQWFSGVLAIPLAIIAASVSYRLVELPFLRLKRRSASAVSGLVPDNRQAVTRSAIPLR